MPTAVLVLLIILWGSLYIAIGVITSIGLRDKDKEAAVTLLWPIVGALWFLKILIRAPRGLYKMLKED